MEVDKPPGPVKMEVEKLKPQEIINGLLKRIEHLEEELKTAYEYINHLTSG